MHKKISGPDQLRLKFVAIVVSGLLAAGSIVGFSLVSYASTPPEINGPDSVSVTLGSSASTSGFVTYTSDLGRTPAPIWILAPDDISAGFAIDSSSGTISLTGSAVAGTRDLALFVRSGTWTNSRSVTVVVSDAPVISGSNDEERTVGQDLDETYSANVPVSWSVDGTDSTSFQISTTGVLRWVGSAPTTPFDYEVSVIATDVNGETDSLTVSVSVIEGPVITGSASVSRTAGRALDETYSADVSVTWSISGDSDRFQIDSEGELSWVGSAPTTIGTYRVDIIATDTNSFAESLEVTVEVTEEPVVTGSKSVSRTAGRALDETYSANVPVTWSVDGTDGSEFEISTAGVLRWVGSAPEIARTYQVDVIATDANGVADTFAVTVEVTEEPVISGSASVSRTADRTLNEDYSANVFVTWSISGDSDRFQIDSAGELSWVGSAPTTTGTYRVDIIATDANGIADTLEVTVEVTAVPVITGSASVSRTAARDLDEDYSANVPVSWSISGDSGRFQIDSDGELSWVGSAPTTTGTYRVDIVATDGNGVSDSFEVTVEVTSDTTAPVITSESELPVITSQDELRFTADEEVTWSLGGPDEDSFSIDLDGVVTAVEGLLEGLYEFIVVARDMFDNIATLLVSFTFAVNPEFESAETSIDGLVVILDYDEDLDESSTPLPGDFTVSGNTIRTVDSVEISGDTVRLTLNLAIINGEIVAVSYVANPARAIQDEAGNDAANLSAEEVTNQVPAPDTTAPTFSSSSPVSTATDVAVSTNVTLRFSEDIDASTSDLTRVYLKDAESDTEVPSSITVVDGDVVIDPNTDLEISTLYYVTWGSNALKDAAGNAAAGVTIETTLFFTTSAAADTTAPTFSSSNPSDNDTDVVINTNVTLNFSEAIEAGTSDLTMVYLKDVASDTLVASSITIIGGNVVINPTANLANSTDYYVTWSSSALKDSSGNAASDIGNETTLNFRTVAAAPTPPSGPGAGPAPTTPPVLPSEAPVKIHTLAFAANSATLTSTLRASIAALLASKPDASSIVCRPVIASINASTAAKTLARARSVAVCNYISKIKPGLDVGIASKNLVATNTQQRRTVRLTIG